MATPVDQAAAMRFERDDDADALVVLRNVSKAYANGTVALRGASLAVRPGEFISLVGPSGCGKSTILRIVAGLGPISAGQVRVAGLAPETARRERQDMAFVFQDATLLPWRNVRRNVELPLQLRGGGKERRAALAMEALATVGLSEFAREYPRQLSGGMKMRVSIARALVAKPSLMLMDEPFGALDELTRGRLNVELLRVVAMAGWTVLFVTHNVFEAVFLSSRVVVMSPRPGRIVADIPIDLPYPREPAMRTGLEFNLIASRVLAHLQEG
ncbi:MAG TPA: ABC transporter ATP-binding protein [Chloroflexota bacterium]|nr:ABC transporter ATP-binding protein [Chloroflexota bacterium]